MESQGYTQPMVCLEIFDYLSPSVNNNTHEPNQKPIKVIYAINRNIEALDKAAIPFQESRNELIEKYCDKKKNGDIVPKKGMEQNLESELGELLDGIEVDIDIYKIPISVVENIEASELEFEAISMMLEESEAEKA